MTDPTNGSADGSTPPPDLHVLTGAYALDAVDDLERRAVQRHLEGCETCREEVRGFRETAAALADGVALAPSAALRDRVLAQVRTTPQLPPVQRGSSFDSLVRDVPVPAARRGARSGRLVAAAVAAVLALGGGTVGVVQYREAQDARAAQRVALAQQQEIANVLNDPARRLVSGPVSSGGRVTVALAGSRAVVLTAGVTGLPQGRTYQLWVIRQDGIRSLGLGPASSDAAGSWARPVTGVRPGDTVAVSVEPDGGSQQPTTTPVAAVEV